MHCHYGYIEGTKGADGEAIDVFLGGHPTPYEDQARLYVIDQVRQDGAFDEHKVMLNFPSRRDAVAMYARHYPPGWLVGPVREFTVPNFRAWLRGDTQAPSLLLQAEEGFSADFGGPSAAVAAADALSDGFAGLTAVQAAEVRQEVIRVMRSQKWSVPLVRDAVQRVLERTGIPHPDVRADVIARTETAALVSEHRLRVYRRQEAEHSRQFLYRDSGVNDHRRTKLSRWIQDTVGAGKTLPECIQAIEDGISLAKAGAFDRHGALRGVPGQPIVLPPSFRRRGFVAHFNERDTFVRVLNPKS